LAFVGIAVVVVVAEDGAVVAAAVVGLFACQHFEIAADCLFVQRLEYFDCN
jgi:hypothetical protein